MCLIDLSLLESQLIQLLYHKINLYLTNLSPCQLTIIKYRGLLHNHNIKIIHIKAEISSMLTNPIALCSTNMSSHQRVYRLLNITSIEICIKLTKQDKDLKITISWQFQLIDIVPKKRNNKKIIKFQASLLLCLETMDKSKTLQICMKLSNLKICFKQGIDMQIASMIWILRTRKSRRTFTAITIKITSRQKNKVKMCCLKRLLV